MTVLTVEQLLTGPAIGRPGWPTKGEGRVVFRFEGMDEMDPADGTATATLVGDRLIFVLSYGPGDEYTFECEQRE
jgi:hypothetical protein